MIATIAALGGRFILAPLASLWRWLVSDPGRMAFAGLLALCGFLGWRLSVVDGDRDDWRDKAKSYETASQIIEDADAIADAEALDMAHETKETIDAQNDDARAAAAGSDDKLRAGLDRLRAQGAGGRDKAAD